MNPQEYITKLADSLTKITMTDFFKSIHSKFYPNQDISFMNYFLELCDHEDQYYVHHSKLVEYRIMTSERSNDVEKRLNNLGMIKGDDYSQQDIKHGGSNKKEYILKPKAFKKCLMRAKKVKNDQPIDPVIYCDYYLLLETIYKLYTDYERMYSQKLISMKDDKIDRLEKKIDEQSDEISKLLGYAKYTKKTLIEVQDDLTETKEEVQLAKTYLVDKSFVSTMDPIDPNKHHYFAATGFIDNNKTQVVKFITGQKSYVDKTIEKNVKELNHKIILNPFFNANPIDLRQNVYDEFKKRRDERIKEINDMNKIKDYDINKDLKKQINEYNKLNHTNKRNYIKEKVKTPLVKTRDISVKFSKLSFTYTINTYIGFNEILQIVIDMNDITQTSPLKIE